MGRRRLENRKVNKSGRFNPELIEKIEERGEALGLNFSQSLEFFSEIGVEVTSPSFYSKIAKISKTKRKEIPQVIKELLTQALDIPV